MIRDKFEKGLQIIDDIEVCKRSLCDLKSFKEDVPNLTCRFTRVSLLGVDKRDVQMPVELADKIADEIKLLLTDRIIELEKEFDAL